MTREVEILTSAYTKEHGASPTGHQAWTFLVVDGSCDQEVEEFTTPSLPYKAAAAWAKKYVEATYANELGTGFVEVYVAA